MIKEKKLIAIYSRKSKYTGKGESIGNQVEMCREYVTRYYGEACEDRIIVFEDEGFSGGNLNRPGFKALMQAAEDKKLEAIVVYRLDRISRNIGDFASLIDKLGHLGIAFISISEHFDTASPMGRAMMYIASIFSQLERETIAERIRDNMHELAKTGRWLGGTTPTGYTSESVKSVTVDGKIKKACKLKLIPEEAELVKKIYELYLETDSLTMTETELLRQRIKTRLGRDFSRFSIKAILQNPVYLIADQAAYDFFVANNADIYSPSSDFDGEHGILAYNRTDQNSGRSTVYLPIDQWIVSVGKHPGIIPSETWLKVQESLERNKNKAYHKPRKNEAILTGLIFCSCGSRMYPRLTSRKNIDGDTIFTYACKRKDRSKGSLCSRKNVNGIELDAAVVEQLKALGEENSFLRSQLEKSKRQLTDNQSIYDQKLMSLRAELADTNKKIDALVDSIPDMGSSAARSRVTARIDELHQEALLITNQIEELERLAQQDSLSNLEFDMLERMLCKFSFACDEMTIEEKRNMIRCLVRKVVWDGEHVHLYLFGVQGGEIDYTGIDDEDASADAEEDVGEATNDAVGEDESMEAEDCLGKNLPPSVPDDRWGEDSE